MNARNSNSADEILERVRGAMVPTEGAATRNFAGIEARLGLASSGALPLNTEHTVGPETGAGNGASSVAPKRAQRATSATRHGPTLAARIGRLASFGLATGLVGYLLGRSQVTPPAAVIVPAIVAPVAVVPSAAPALESLNVVPSDSLREGVSGASPAAAVEEAPTRSAKPLAMSEGVPQRSRARTAPRAMLQRAAASARAAPAAADPGLQLGEALELLRRAESAVQNSDGLEARMWLGDLDRRAPREMLREERLATSVLADCVLGDVTAARAALTELEQANAASLYRARLATRCAAPASSP
jgi:hypothetical protein